MSTKLRTLFAALLLACGGPEVDVDAGEPDASFDAGMTAPDAGPDAGEPPEEDAGPMDAGAPIDSGGSMDAGFSCVCDDSVDCTEDGCDSERCVYTPRHGRCDPGSFCGPSGCMPGGVCISDADCPTDTDACTTRMRCDLASRQCTWEILDGDGDGHAPVVCGGLDCADATPGVHPSAVETCNGRDDDCDGVVDGASTICGVGLICVAGECVCAAAGATFCGAALGCRVLNGDPMACGTCATACMQSGALCDAGECRCPAGTEECSDACADLGTSTAHCGVCENACAAGGVCSAGRCACPAGTTECAGDCVALASNAGHCGACDLRCIEGASCTAGSCSTSIGFLRGFQSTTTLRVADLLVHPSGELTLLLHFRTTLDELPFRPLAATTTNDDVYISRRSSTGDEIWSKLLAANGNDSFSLHGSPDREDFLVAGSLSGSLDFGDGMPVTAGFSGVLAMARYDRLGGLLWKRAVYNVGSTNSGPGYVDGALYPDGSVAVLASLNTTADFGGGVFGTTGCCTRWAVARYAAANGAHLASWELPVVGLNGVRGYEIEPGPGDAVMVGGSYEGGAAVFGSTILPGPNNSFVATYNPSGVPTNAFIPPIDLGFRFGGGYMAVASDGDIFLAGSSVLLGRFAPDGMVRWTVPGGTVGTTMAYTSAIHLAADGDLFVRGWQSGRFDFGFGPVSGEMSSTMSQYRDDGTLVRVRGIVAEGTRPPSMQQFVRGASGAWVAAGEFTEPLTFQDRTLVLTAPPGVTMPAHGAYLLSFDP